MLASHRIDDAPNTCMRAGNAFDASPYVSISQETDAFTSSDVYTYRRSMTVSVDGGLPTCFQHASMLLKVLETTFPFELHGTSYTSLRIVTPGPLHCGACLLQSSFLHAPGLNATSYQPGNMLRFQLLFRLTSNLNSNYLHIHRLKGIIQASTVRMSLLSPCN